MTSNPITIGGETLSAEDWPVESEFYYYRAADDRHFFNEPCTDYEVLIYENACRLKLFAAVARCYFLDKAEEAESGAVDAVRIGSTTLALMMKESQERYLASAAKWARIGRNKKENV